MSFEQTFITFFTFMAILAVSVIAGYALRKHVVWLYCILAMAVLCGMTFGRIDVGLDPVPFLVGFAVPTGALLGSLTRAKPRR